MTRRTATWTAAVLTVGLTASGCGLGTAGGFSPSGTPAGPIAHVPRLDGQKISVGSKNFTEQILLGKIMVILIQSAGADVKDYTNIPGSASSRQAQLDGQIDAQWEYTGTGWIAYLGQSDPIPDEQKQYTAVRDLDLKKNGLVWLKPAPMNNTYALATTAKTQQELGIKTLTDIQKVPADRRTFCVDSEFAARNDGFQPMLQKYGLKYGEDVTSRNVKVMTEGAIYSATASGTCTFGEVFTTDGRIKALNLAVLDDPKSFFPKYNASAVIRKETLDAKPQLRQLLEPVSAKLTDETVMELNRQIDVDGREPADVAYDWLRQSGFITG